MKCNYNILLLGLIMQCSLAITVSAQSYLTLKSENDKYPMMSDTVSINLGGRDRLVITGKTLADYVKVGAAFDAIKTAFINDYNQAISNAAIDKEAQHIYYFVLNEQQRRLKVESTSFSNYGIDIGYEKYRMLYDLPKYHIAWYYLATDVQMHFYFDNPDSILPKMSLFSIEQAMAKMNEEQKRFNKITHFKIQITPTGFQYTPQLQRRFIEIEANPSFGITIIGNTFSPITELNLMGCFNNKYNNQVIRAGISLAGGAFYDQTPDLSNQRFFIAYDLKTMFNLNRNNRGNPYWVGFNIGTFRAPEIAAIHKGMKFGLLYDGPGLVNYGVEFMNHQSDGNKDQSIYMLNIRFPF